MSNVVYRLSSTESTHNGLNHWDDSVYKSKDTIKRLDDGRYKTFTRAELAARFKDIENLDPKPVTKTKKSKKAKAKNNKDNYGLKFKTNDT